MAKKSNAQQHTDFQKQVTNMLKTKGAWILNVHGHMMQKVGIPDFQCIHRRWSGFIEIKTGKGQCSLIQKKVIRELKDRYYPALVLRPTELTIRSSHYAQIIIENERGIEMRLCNFDDLLDTLVRTCRCRCGNCQNFELCLHD